MKAEVPSTRSGGAGREVWSPSGVTAGEEKEEEEEEEEEGSGSAALPPPRRWVPLRAARQAARGRAG